MSTPLTQEQLNAQLVLQLQAMQAQMAHLQQAVPQAVPQAAPRVAEPRMAAPPTCDGKAAALDGWIAALERQFAWYGYATPAQDAQRIRLATSVLTGDAWDWWSHLATQPATWTGLVAAMRARFQPVTSAETARAKLVVLSQGKASVNEYISAFRRLLVAVPTMGEDDRLFHFTRGLRPAIATQLRVHGVTTLNAAIEMAARVGSIGELAGLAPSAASTAGPSSGSAPMELDALGIEGLEQETGAVEGSSNPSPVAEGPSTQALLTQLLAAMQMQRRPFKAREGGAPSAPSASSSPSPLHRDASGRLQFGSLTQSQMDAHWTAGTCFHCGKAGHLARKCPSAPKPKQGN